jgi:hypothetical protein
MPKDEQMRVVRAQINNVIRLCADAAARGGPSAVMALMVEESSELPAKPPFAISDAYADQLRQQAAAKASIWHPYPYVRGPPTARHGMRVNDCHSSSKFQSVRFTRTPNRGFNER